MKTKITLLFLLIGWVAFAQEYFYIPDANFKAALIEDGVDSNADGEIDIVEAWAVTTLNINNESISDLKGINHFTSLNTLIISNNNLLTVDLSELSQLVVLNCSNNDLLMLDLRYNEHLGVLLCQNNDLHHLNVQNGANITINTTEFKATNNPNLNCITVDDASYSSANWTQIDATANFSVDCMFNFVCIPDDNFEQALIDLGHDSGVLDNFLTMNVDDVTSLNITNKSIANLTGIEAFISLENLYVYLNNLKYIDLEYNPNLQVLYCESNNMEYLRVTDNEELQTLNCGYNLLTELKLHLNEDLVKLRCQDNNLTDLTLTTNTQLSQVWCQNNNLTFLDIKNGNNTDISNTLFDVTNNPDLNCIVVDDVAWSSSNWTYIDAGCVFSESVADCASLGNNELETNKNLTIYPNPFSNKIEVQILNDAYPITELSLLDVKGNVLLSDKSITLEDLDELANGVYILKIKYNNSNYFRKIIKN